MSSLSLWSIQFDCATGKLFAFLLVLEVAQREVIGAVQKEQLSCLHLIP